MPSYIPLIIHASVVIAGIAAYAALTALGHDGTPVLAAALSYGTGAGAQALVPSGTLQVRASSVPKTVTTTEATPAPPPAQ